jgi:serine/threonine protein kinase
MAGQPVKPAETLAERFWSVARELEPDCPPGVDPDAVAVVRHVLKVLDLLDAGHTGRGVTSNTLNFLMLLRQYQASGDLTYASPEMARGEDVSDSSLVFSVGVLLFEKLTGRHPFGAEAAGRRLARMQKGELGSGVAYFPKLPEKLRHVLMCAMGPFPEDRYGTLPELRSELERFVDGETRQALPGVSRGDRSLDSVVTRVVSVNTLQTMARLSAERAPDTPSPDLILPATSLRPSASRYAPIGWIALGAALASLIFILLGERRSEPPTASAAPSPVVPPSPAKPAPAPVPPPPPPPVAATAPSEGTFDPALGGRRSLDNARACFGPDRIGAGVLFGAGLLYGADGVSRKVYFGTQEKLSPDERRCVARSLLGVSAGGPAGKNQIVEYVYRYRSTGAEVKVRGK